jgi:hypothetical protein
MIKTSRCQSLRAAAPDAADLEAIRRQLGDLNLK